MDEPIPLLDRGNGKGGVYTQQAKVGESGKFNNARTTNATGFFRPFVLFWQDIKSLSRYGREHKRQFWLNTVAGLILLLTLASTGLSQLLLTNQDYLTVSPYCPPGGDFDFRSAYNPWDSKHFFQITLGFGKLSFAEAKAIDIVWDVIVGRGGQFILSMITFIVFSKCIMRLMEREGEFITYGTFRAVIFEEPSLRSTRRLIMDLRSRLDWRARASILWFILASTYVVAFPTYLSAMTGYSANVNAYFVLDNSELKSPIPASETGYFHRAIYIIHDAERIDGANLSTPYVVGSRGFGLNASNIENEYYKCLGSLHYYGGSRRNSTYYECALAQAISDYIDAYDTTPQNTGSVLNISTYDGGKVYQIPSPTLNIEVFNTNEKVYSRYKLSVGKKVAGQESKLSYMYTTTEGTSAYNEQEVSRKGTCDSQTTYNWGFSFLLLFSFLSITSVWVLGMYVMWSETYWNSRLDRAGRQMGFYRGIADISNAMWKDMLREPTDLASESTIRKMLEAQCNNGKIEFEHMDRGELPVPRKVEFRAWKKDIILLSGWSKTWTVAHWIWFMIFSIFTIGGALMAVAYLTYLDFEYLKPSALSYILTIIGLGIASIFGFPAVAMLTTGLTCTLRRWTRRSVDMTRRRPRSGHQRISDDIGDSAEPLQRVQRDQTTP